MNDAYDVHRLRELAGEIIINVRELSRAGLDAGDQQQFLAAPG